MSNRAGGYQQPDPESFVGRGAWAVRPPEVCSPCGDHVPCGTCINAEDCEPSGNSGGLDEVDLVGLDEAHRRIFDEVQYPDNGPTPNPLHQHMAATFEECLAISKAKNAGYACDADPLANFKTATSLGVSVSTGIAVRMADKWSRLCRLMKTGKNPLPSESITDTLQDLINYAAILLYALDQGEEK